MLRFMGPRGRLVVSALASAGGAVACIATSFLFELLPAAGGLTVGQAHQVCSSPAGQVVSVLSVRAGQDCGHIAFLMDVLYGGRIFGFLALIITVLVFLRGWSARRPALYWAPPAPEAFHGHGHGPTDHHHGPRGGTV